MGTRTIEAEMGGLKPRAAELNHLVPPVEVLVSASL